MTRMIFGIAINDQNEPVTKGKMVDGKWVQTYRCPIHKKWYSMLARCYSGKYKPYLDCMVCDEWLIFSNFKKWVNTIQPCNDWIDKALDKDLLVSGNKKYSHDTCVFVDVKINNFILDSESGRGKLLCGVCLSGRTNKPYISQCCNPFNKKKSYIGYYETEIEAHIAWKTKKHEYAVQLAETEQDPRIKEILLNKYK